MSQEVLITILSTVLIGWIAWLSITTIQNKSKIEVLSKMADEVHDIKNDIKGTNERLDTFLNREIETLTRLASK
jgi:hypothetical protein